MRICNRCQSKNIVAPLLNKKDGSEYDLCKDCMDAFNIWVDTKPVQKPTADKKGGSK